MQEPRPVPPVLPEWQAGLPALPAPLLKLPVFAPSKFRRRMRWCCRRQKAASELKSVRLEVGADGFLHGLDEAHALFLQLPVTHK
ncbi:hypothetical protein [Rhizobium sp. NXC14]|uniref:hypothetical protein n=1 Tax=Rhizobium sp. NXC14 TaxID=1981173 RepID=UPI0018DDB474|nr:hypothetical protein [Rhizobium sp. NXC14]